VVPDVEVVNCEVVGEVVVKLVVSEVVVVE